jgi:hypothetical protein
MQDRPGNPYYWKAVEMMQKTFCPALENIRLISEVFEVPFQVVKHDVFEGRIKK